MAITFVGVTAVPTDAGANADSSGSITIDKDAGAGASCQSGDLLVLIVNQRVTGQTLSVAVSGGQSWNSLSSHASGSQTQQIFWARYEAPWTADIQVNTTSTGGNALSAYLLVFRPTGRWNTWDIDVALQTGNATPTTPFDVTRAGQTTLTNSTVTLAYWFLTNSTATTWTLQTGGWSNPNSESQWRNTTGTDTSVSTAYKIQTAAGATGSVVNRQGTATGITTLHGIVTFKEITQPPRRAMLMGVG